MDTHEKIMILVEAVVNGHKIKGDTYYMNMLNRIPKSELQSFAQDCMNVNHTCAMYANKTQLIYMIAKG